MRIGSISKPASISNAHETEKLCPTLCRESLSTSNVKPLTPESLRQSRPTKFMQSLLNIAEEETHTLIDRLLAEQQTLAPVVRFARVHQTLAPSPPVGERIGVRGRSVPTELRYYRDVIPLSKPK